MKILLAAGLLALSASALAQSGPPANSDSSSATSTAGQRMRDRFVNADTDHDGRLSRSEAQALPWLAKHFDEVDSNHDGYISREEFRAAMQQRRAMREQRSGQQGSGQHGPDQQGSDGSNAGPSSGSPGSN